MPKLEVHLREGFADDDVEIRINHQSALKLPHVSTDWSLGLAAKKEIQIAAGSHVLEAWSKGKLLAQATRPINADAYLLVRKEADHMVFDFVAEPPVYL